MKIGIVYPYFAHYRGPIIEEMLNNKEGIDYHFLGGSLKPNSLNTLKLYDFKGNDRFILLNNFWIKDVFLIQKNLMYALKKENFDALVFLGDWKYLNYWKAVNYFTKRNIPCMFWGHGILKEKNDINTKIKKHFLSKFNHGGFLYSHNSKKIMKNMGYKNDLVVIYNSLNYNKHKELIAANVDSDLNLFKNSHPYLIFSGRLIDSRRLDIVLDAVKFLADKNVFINFLIIGTGPSEKELKKQAETLKITKYINFFGSCYDDKLLTSFFVNSLGCVFPGPIGLTLIHAMTYGVPVLTNDDVESHKPEFEAFTNNETGFLFKKGDSFSLAKGIEKLIELSESKRKKIEIFSKNVVQDKYNPKVQVEIMNNKFKTIFK